MFRIYLIEWTRARCQLLLGMEMIPTFRQTSALLQHVLLEGSMLISLAHRKHLSMRHQMEARKGGNRGTISAEYTCSYGMRI